MDAAWVGPVVSLFGALTAMVAAYRTYVLSENQTRTTVRHEFQKMMMDVSKEQMHDTKLWAIYDDHPIHVEAMQDKDTSLRVQSFGFYLANTFEVVIVYFLSSAEVRERERNSFAAWSNYLRYALGHSSILRDILFKSPESDVYNSEFLDFASALHTGKSHVVVGDDYLAIPKREKPSLTH